MIQNSYLRIDKWLWHARFFKTRTQATKFCKGGKLRINNVIIKKSHFRADIGDVLTFIKERTVRIIRIKKLTCRRGSAREATELYEDLKPVVIKSKRDIEKDSNYYKFKNAIRDPGSGRPTKADRRAIEKLSWRHR